MAPPCLGGRPRRFGASGAGGVRVSTDGKVRWMDNVFIERLRRSLKYECVYLNHADSGSEAMAGIGNWIRRDNSCRPHSALGGNTPDNVCFKPSSGHASMRAAAA